MANTGFEEAGTEDYIKYAIKRFAEIGTKSKHRKWYISFLESVLFDLYMPRPTEKQFKICRLYTEDRLRNTFRAYFSINVTLSS